MKVIFSLEGGFASGHMNDLAFLGVIAHGPERFPLF